MKTRKILVFVVLAMSFMLFSGCDDGTSNPSSQIRFYNDSSSVLYFTLGDYDGTYTDPITSWVTVNTGNYSSYQSFTPGTHYFCYDEDIDHTNFTVYTNSYAFADGKKYTFTQDDSSASISIDN